MIALYWLILAWWAWYAYVLVMGLYRAKLNDRLHGLSYVLAMPAVAVGYALDFLTNVFVASVVFVELPREVLVTQRLKRHLESAGTWRSKLARQICHHLLDPFDPNGSHCV